MNEQSRGTQYGIYYEVSYSNDKGCGKIYLIKQYSQTSQQQLHIYEVLYKTSQQWL